MPSSVYKTNITLSHSSSGNQDLPDFLSIERELYVNSQALAKSLDMETDFNDFGIGVFKKTKKAKILIMTKDFSFLILLRFYLLCFLMKTAVAIPLKKSRKRKINVFLRGSCFVKGSFHSSL